MAKSPEMKIVPAPKKPSPIAKRHSSTIQIHLRKQSQRPKANGQKPRNSNRSRNQTAIANSHRHSYNLLPFNQAISAFKTRSMALAFNKHSRYSSSATESKVIAEPTSKLRYWFSALYCKLRITTFKSKSASGLQ